MKHMSKLALFGLVFGVMAGSNSAARAQGMPVNPNLAKRGRELFLIRSCDACHGIGKGRRAGPDLLGVTDRRSQEWLRKWLKDPAAMLASDSLAMQLKDEYKGVSMANPRLTNSDIEALINYLADATRKARK